MWILSKMRHWNCEFCEKWDIEIVNFWIKLRIFAPVCAAPSFAIIKQFTLLHLVRISAWLRSPFQQCKVPTNFSTLLRIWPGPGVHSWLWTISKTAASRIWAQRLSWGTTRETELRWHGRESGKSRVQPWTPRPKNRPRRQKRSNSNWSLPKWRPREAIWCL